MTENLLHERIGTKEYGEETIEMAIDEIQSISNQLQLPTETTQVAETIYRRGLRTHIVSNSTIAQLSASAVYTACRTQNVPYTSTEISQASSTSKAELESTFTELVEQTGLKGNIGPVDPEQYIPEYCARLGLTSDVEEKSIEIAQESKDRNLLSGKSPSAFAASSIYIGSLLCNNPRTQNEISIATGVSERALRDRYQEQAEWILEEIDE